MIDPIHTKPADYDETLMGPGFLVFFQYGTIEIGGYEPSYEIAKTLPYKRFEIETPEQEKAVQVMQEMVQKIVTPAQIKPDEMELAFRLRMIEMQIRFELIYLDWLEQCIEQRRRYLAAIFLLLQ